jgi:phage FluMu gp28-like protein
MASLMQPLATTIRVLEWDDLPASVRDIPAEFDPTQDGVLMLHQRQVAALPHSIIAVPKGRRTGITFCTMLNKTITAASRKTAGGRNVFYIGDTREKGLEAIGYCAKFSRVIAKAQGQGVSGIEEFLFEDQTEDGRTRHINAYRIRFASGYQVCALSSRPANIRGLQGDVVIDEAAFHPDVQGVMDAATALLIWGGRIVVISSHNGKGNPFNQFCKDIEAGRYGTDAVVMTVTFDDAVANGLYERVCHMKGDKPTPEGKKTWYERIRNGYGTRKAAMREELDAIPRDGSGVCLPGVWIENAMREQRPVLRLALDDDFVRRSEEERRSYVQDWIDRYVVPVLATLNPRLRHVFAQDYARHRDFSIFGPLAIEDNLRRVCPFILEMHKVPARQQEQILWFILDRLPRRCGGAMDATGSGETIAEYTADRYGHSHVHQVKVTRAWYGTWMPKLIGGFEDGMIDLPQDANTAADLRQIEDVDGIPMVAKPRTKDLKDPELTRHGDAASMLVLAWFASLNMSGQIDYIPVPAHPRGFDNLRAGDRLDADDDLVVPEPRGW